MTITAIGLFDGFSEAQRVTHTLAAQGVRREAITIVANRDETAVSDVIAAVAWGVNVDVGPACRGEPAALIALGVPADAAQPYAEGMTRGGTLVSVAAADGQADQVLALMERYTAEEFAAQTAPRSMLTRWRPSAPPRTVVTQT
jgi:hypothetical protein